MRGHADLRAAVAASLLCAVLALLLPLPGLRVVFAVPLALFLPGYAVVAVTFARRQLELPQRLLLSLGLSLVTLALGAVLLNYLPGGIRAGSWALLLVLVVLGACRGAALRRPKATGTGLAIPRFSPRRTELGLLAAGALAVLAALILAFVPLSAKNAVGYTEMWIKPFSNDSRAGVKIGVGNREQAGAEYRLRVHIGREGEETLTYRLALEPGQTQVRVIRTATRSAGPPTPVVAVLVMADSPTKPYRRVSAWIPPTGESG
jgi:uncharacterized membrane protein